jgi:hypothetical protein
MNAFGRFLRDTRNQQVVWSLGGALVVVATASAVFVYLLPTPSAPETKASDPTSLNIQGAVAQPAPIIAAPAVHSQGGAAQKTVKACQEEWRAFKAANQAKGITEKAYIAECRAGTVAASPTISVPAMPSEGVTQKTVKACQDEWRAIRAANQKTTTEKAYVAQCRTAATATSPAVTASPDSPSGPAVSGPMPAASPAGVGSAGPKR